MKRNDLSRALVAFDQDSTIVAVIEQSLKTWLVSSLVPGVLRQPLTACFPPRNRRANGGHYTLLNGTHAPSLHAQHVTYRQAKQEDQDARDDLLQRRGR